MYDILKCAFVVVALSLAGCGRNNCAVACQRNRDCVNSNLDVNGCTNTCNSQSQGSATTAGYVTDCVTCLDKYPTCSDAVNQCGGKCILVPGYGQTN